MAVICGVRGGDGVSDFYKATISQQNEQFGHVTVAGYVSGETVISLNQIWNNPFEDNTAGNSLQVTGGLVQSSTDATSKALVNSKLIWEGAEPLSFSLTLNFIAYADAQREVDDPIKYLMMMSSPELNETLPFGQRPQLCKLNLGRKLVTDIYVQSVEYNANAPRTPTGNFAHNQVLLQCSLDGARNASEVPRIFR